MQSILLYLMLGFVCPQNDEILIPINMKIDEFIELAGTMQPMLKDFRCEYEGKVWAVDEHLRSEKKLDRTGLLEKYSGFYMWNVNGNIFVDSFHSSEPGKEIIRSNLIVRTQKNEAESYIRPTDVSIGRANISSADRVNASGSGSLGQFFVLDQIRKMSKNSSLDVSIFESKLDGKKTFVVIFSLKLKDRNQIFSKTWFDLSRGGCAVKHESYGGGGALIGRLVIDDIRAFMINGTTIWMPVHGIAESYASLKDGKPIAASTPTWREILYINHGTLEFNKNISDSEFTIKYKPGTPIVDNLRQMQLEYGRQQPPLKPSRAKAEELLNQQLNAAAEQRTELVVAPISGGVAWYYWILVVSFVGMLILLVVILTRRG